MLEKRKKLGNAFKLFFLGEPLTVFVPTAKKGKLTEAVLKAHGAELPIQVEFKSKNQSTVALKLGEKFITAKVGEWSEWEPLELKVKESTFASHVKFSPIKVWDNGSFRIRVLFNGLNRFNTEPGEVATELTKGVGPMIDHLDNWPPQLIFENEDKRVSMDEVRMSLDWHRRAAAYIPEKFKPDVFIQDTYTPNQMLESRWWHGDTDKTRKGYNPKKAEAAMNDILEMYQGLDAIIGEAMAKKDDDTVIVFSSDHGVCPLHRLVHLNNLFAKKGWLKFTVDPKTGEAKIDWKNTKVVYMKMLHVYINPNGLDGNWKRGSGPEFEKLRDEVIKTLTALKDINGQSPLVKAVKWEDAKDVYRLPQDRIGDLVLEAKLNYFWYEEADASGKVFSTPLTTGYKQSIDPLKNKCMWTPFLVWGPGVKKGYAFKEPISHVDQLPTIYKLMGVEIPKHVQGRVLQEALY
jgi:predicted AlkP superfamily phosphohydrolase/phosphomutase